MQAVVRHGGKQYVVTENTELRLPKITTDAKTINLEVLAIIDEKNNQIGTPNLPEAKVVAEIVSDLKGKKLYIRKFKNKAKYRRKTGYRDQQTIIKIKSITA